MRDSISHGQQVGRLVRLNVDELPCEITMPHSRRVITVMKAFVLVLLMTVPCHAQSFKQFNKVVKYDRLFSKYTKRFFGPNFDWKYFKAQAVAESQLNPKAKSHVGALGIMQIMPKTYKEILRKNPSIKGSREHPRWNIAAGIYYDRILWKEWKAERPFQDRVNFMLGSFNAGKGNILKAQKIAKQKGLNQNLWEAIEKALPAVTGKRSQETIGYVRKISEIKGDLR